MIEVETGKPIWAMGLMSGTSMDGVDAALLRTDGEQIFAFGPGAEISPAYNERQKQYIGHAGGEAAAMTDAVSRGTSACQAS